ncbi:MAG: hypothetical protein V4463_02025 [Pseudomonadota bacterium]
MPRRFGQALRIGVAPGSLALVKTSRWFGEPLAVLAECAVGGTSMEDLAQALRALLTGVDGANWPVSFVLADELVRMWQVTPPQTATRVADLEAAAALRFQSLYGESAQQWKISGDWNAQAPFLACAMERPLLSVLEQGALEHGMRIVDIVPQFVAAWNAARTGIKAGSWFGQVYERVLTLGVDAQVRAAAIPEGAGHDWLVAHLGREALRLDTPMPTTLHLGGAVPATWNKSADALACLVHASAPGRSSAMQLACSGSGQ